MDKINYSNLKYSHVLIWIFLFLVGTPLKAQQNVITVSGEVIDDTNEPVIGATVVAKGLKTGLVTDIDGKYSIKVPSLVLNIPQGSFISISHLFMCISSQ